MKPEQRTVLTLDNAIERFREADGSNLGTAADLLMTALQYWHDDMIGDEEFGELVGEVARDLNEMRAGK